MSNRRNKTTTQNFNKLAMECVEDYNFKNTKNMSKSKYKTEKEYQNSFDDIIKFQSKFTDTQKKSIDIVAFHNDNNDGVVSAYFAWKYLMFENKKDVKFVGLKPGKSKGVDYRVKNIVNIINGKNVLILDLDYNEETFNFMKQSSKMMMVIDDHHGGKEYNDPNAFIGKNHAAVAYTFKFFYPKENVPKVVQYVDDSDAKLFLPFIPFPDLFSSALGFRFVHNIFMPIGPNAFEKMHIFFKDDNVNFFIFLGKYFEQVKDNLKNQIAQNARIMDFQGYKVGTLNFNSPALSKPVGRQIVSNFNRDRDVINFAVLFGYEFTVSAWRVQLIDDHKQTKINLKEIAEKLGKISGHPRGAGGHVPHVGNFYWTGDIFDLFKKKNI